MRYEVLLLSRAGLQGWWGKTCLARPEFQVHGAVGYDEALQALASRSFDFVVIENPPSDTGLPGFLGCVRDRMANAPIKTIVVTKSEDPTLQGPPVAMVLRPPFTPQHFDETVVGILGVKPKETKRYLVHAYYASEGTTGKTLGLATTLDLNTGGMLVESSSNLPIKKNLVWTFGGVPQLRWIAVPGTITESESGAKGSGLKRYHVTFDQNPTPERRALTDFLEEREAGTAS